MAFERKDNSGAVFNNERKEKDTHPDRTGDAVIGGVPYWVNGWLKKDKNGKPFLSLSFNPKDKTIPVAKADGKNVVGRGDDMSDEIPFAAEFR
jgi:hypothetical protein